MKTMQKDVFMYLSSWGRHGDGIGLCIYRFDQENGILTLLKEADDQNPHGQMWIDRDRKLLYVCNETEFFPGHFCRSGRIFTYRIDPSTGDLTRISEITTNCPDPCYLSVDGSRKYLMVAHHSVMHKYVRHVRTPDGQLTITANPLEADLQLYRLDENGIPAELLDNIDHRRYQNPEDDAHPHSCTVSPSGDLIAVADKGSGYLYMYRINENAGRFEMLDRALTDRPGAYPRHVVFHPYMPFLYVNHEATLDNRPYVSVFRYTRDGRLKREQIIDAAEGKLSWDEKIVLQQQGLAITADGSHLYTLINSANRIAAFSIDSREGTLRRIQNIPVKGSWPRSLTLSPNDRFLITGCMISGDIGIYRRHTDGTLTLHREGPVQKGASFGAFLPE